MIKQFIDVPMKHGSCDSYVAHLEGATKRPAVMLLMDAFGPRPWLYEMADKLATHGYFVFVPNLFYRSRRAPVIDAEFPLKAEEMQEVFKSIMPMYQALTTENALADAEQFMHYLGTRSEIDPKKKIGATGYCMGGYLALRFSAAFPEKIGAVCSYHAGRTVSEAPDSVHKLLPKIKAQAFVAHADNDASMTAEQIVVFDKAFQEAHIKGSTELYKGAMHGFTMLDLPAGNPAALEKHWQSLFATLKQGLEL